MLNKRKKAGLSRGAIRYEIIIIVVLIILIAVLSWIFLQKLAEKESIKEISIPVAENIEDTEKIEAKKEQKTSMSLVMVGDYLIHSSVYKDATKNAGGTGYDFKPMIQYIKEKVKNYDLAYYNQETILGGAEIGVSDYPNFNSPYEAGDAMIDAGFNLVSLATNHTMDSGTKAVINSRKYWDNQKNVLATGSYNSFETQNEIQIKQSSKVK